MADHSRLDDLRRRVENDPASIAFAQLAEEYRRAGDYQQSVDVCHAGLHIHPGYLSARVTLGRALLELNDLDAAQQELDEVLRHAPENLAAIRGLAEIHHRRGHLPEALSQYKAALAIARNDPDLERTVEELSREVAPQPREEPADGLTFEHLHRELLQAAANAAAKQPHTIEKTTEPSIAPPPRDEFINLGDSGPASGFEDLPLRRDESAFAASPLRRDEPSEPQDQTAATTAVPELAVVDEPAVAPELVPEPVRAWPAAMTETARPMAPEPADVFTPPVQAAAATKYNVVPDATRERAERTITALEQWLDALNVARTHPCA